MFFCFFHVIFQDQISDIFHYKFSDTFWLVFSDLFMLLVWFFIWIFIAGFLFWVASLVRVESAKATAKTDITVTVCLRFRGVVVHILQETPAKFASSRIAFALRNGYTFGFVVFSTSALESFKIGFAFWYFCLPLSFFIFAFFWNTFPCMPRIWILVILKMALKTHCTFLPSPEVNTLLAFTGGTICTSSTTHSRCGPTTQTANGGLVG